MTDKKTVLIVEDDPVTRRLVETALSKKGYQTLSTDNGEQALVLVREHHPDLMTLDLMLPGSHGFSVCRTIKQDEHLRVTKVLVLTAKSYDTDRDTAMGVGADDYLVKPVYPSHLIEKIEALIGNPDEIEEK